MSTDTPTRIYPPWDDDQVKALNAYQAAGRFHPFTCGGGHSGQTELVATTDGWVCPRRDCGYEQRWAHAGMAEAWASEPFVWPPT